MRASTVRCRFLDRRGDSLGVESSFKDICILAAVLNTVDAEVSLGRLYLRASFRGAVIEKTAQSHKSHSNRNGRE